MAREFKAGDVVQLKSGGPTMTVTSVSRNMDGTPLIRCTWFAGKKKENGAFPPETLITPEKQKE